MPSAKKYLSKIYFLDFLPELANIYTNTADYLSILTTQK